MPARKKPSCEAAVREIRRRARRRSSAEEKIRIVLDGLRGESSVAELFFRKLLKGQEREPRRLVTDKLRSYAAAHRRVMTSVLHDTSQYANNRAEVSHQPTRMRERQMRRFKSPSPFDVLGSAT